MIKPIYLPAVIIICLCLITLSSISTARISPELNPSKESADRLSQSVPDYGVAAHRVGKIKLTITNNGTFGTGFSRASDVDIFYRDQLLSCEYPKNSNNEYLFSGAFWIGAVVNRDTLVSTGAGGDEWVREFHPDEAPFGTIVRRSLIDPTSEEYEGAISEEDFICVYYDTLTGGVDADHFGRPHVPLNIEVTEASYAWSYAYAEDFVLFDYKIRNIGSSRLKDVYMGVYVDADIHLTGISGGFDDDLCGFVHTFPSDCNGIPYIDTVNIAWTADNDGDLSSTPPSGQPVPHVTATRIVRTPAEELDVSFNWWIRNGSPELNFGPREQSYKGRWKEEFRNFHSVGLGSPLGDANKYYLLRNREFDYDQAFTASIQSTDTLWMYPPPEHSASWSSGLDTRYVLSFGPFDINPGEVLPLSFAYVGGENFHTDANNFSNLAAETYNPHLYYSNLDFSDLALNARWASWIYDNPGVDTDSDGYAGEFLINAGDSILIDSTIDSIVAVDTFWTYIYEYYDVDTCWITGDGEPDFKGASPPPPPEFWLTPNKGSINVRFNGLRSENTPDVFSRTIDFEGYHVYIGRDERSESYSLVASYDREDYNKWIYDDYEWILIDDPFKLDELRSLYGASMDDESFDPLDYTPSSPLRFGDSLFYFTRQDHNTSTWGVSTPIKKIYPEQPKPSNLNPDSADGDELTEDGYFKYYEYEFTIDHLLPSVNYYVNVTAFDFGSPASGLPSLESSLSLNAQCAYPLEHQTKVFVYPNPYRIDADYRRNGFEGRMDFDRPDDRVRQVHFANLPAICTISIFSLDGDLIRELSHNVPESDPNYSHDTWDLITRNTQLVVSGLYYWTVEDENGQVQIGKLMIIM